MRDRQSGPIAGTPDPARLDLPPRMGRSKAWPKVVLGIMLGMIAIAGGGGLWYAYAQSRYYVGASNDYLAIYRGVAEPQFGMLPSQIVQVDDTRIADLPLYYQELVRVGLPASSLNAARDALVVMRDKAAVCIQQRIDRTLPVPASPVPASPSASSPDAPTEC